jgi:hypothetical protein
MKSVFLRLVVCAILFLLCDGPSRRSVKVDVLPAAVKAQPEEAQEEEPEEPPIRAATPEDPGPIATVVGPLAVWTKRAEVAQQLQAARESDPANPPVEKPVSLNPQLADHVALSASPDSSHFLHQIFAVKGYSQFTFVVPPHMMNPKLRGNYRSFAIGEDPDYPGAKAADVDLMLLNEREFTEFANGRRGSATYEVDSSHNQAVDYAVPSTYDRAQLYHLVFCNPRKSETRFVDADFTISFE